MLFISYLAVIKELREVCITVPVVDARHRLVKVPKHVCLDEVYSGLLGLTKDGRPHVGGAPWIVY
jgi:hypothetical protein